MNRLSYTIGENMFDNNHVEAPEAPETQHSC